MSLSSPPVAAVCRDRPAHRRPGGHGGPLHPAAGRGAEGGETGRPHRGRLRPGEQDGEGLAGHPQGHRVHRLPLHPLRQEDRTGQDKTGRARKTVRVRRLRWQTGRFSWGRSVFTCSCCTCLHNMFMFTRTGYDFKQQQTKVETENQKEILIVIYCTIPENKNDVMSLVS